MKTQKFKNIIALNFHQLCVHSLVTIGYFLSRQNQYRRRVVL